MATKLRNAIGLLCLTGILIAGCSQNHVSLKEYADVDLETVKEGVDQWIHTWDQTRLAMTTKKYVVDMDKDPLDRKNWTIVPKLHQIYKTEAIIASPHSWQIDVKQTRNTGFFKHSKYSWHDSEFRSLGGIETERQTVIILPEGTFKNGMMAYSHFLTPMGIRFFETPNDIRNLMDEYPMTIQGREDVEGYNCVRLASPPDDYQVQLWVDPQHHYVVRKARMDYQPGKSNGYHFVYILKETQLLKGVTIPSRAVYYLAPLYRPETGIRLREWFLESAECDATIRDQDMTIEPPPATYVLDYKQKIQYNVNEQGNREKIEKLKENTGVGCCTSSKCTKPGGK